MNTKKLRNVAVPCGKCPACISRRTSGWSFRLMQEFKVSDSAYFITLTYDTNHVPITDKGFMSLRKSDVQLFFKRLRKAHDIDAKRNGCNKVSLKYFAVGEYGGKTKRPHYHIILFNSQVELISKAWSKDGKDIGQIHFGDVNEASVGYTLKYMQKPAWRPDHKNDDRYRQFQLMSKGLGANYLSENMVKWHKATNAVEDRVYCNLKDGKKIAMPRYYKDKIYTEDERKRIAYFGKVKFMELEQKEIIEHGENRHAVKADIHINQFNKMHYASQKMRDKI